MKLIQETNRIVAKEWMKYHPYSDVTALDNYYIALCNKVLKIISQSEMAGYLNGVKEEKTMACLLTAYFEDVISETRMFSTFTRLHKKMYGKALPFYDIPDEEYYDDEVNLYDIYFLIWYYMSIQDKTNLYDPYIENDMSIAKAIAEIYELFENEFEEAPQNEKLHEYLHQMSNKDVKTVREKLSFLAQSSFLWEATFSIYFNEILEPYKKNGVVVMDEKSNMGIYDQQILFIFNECLPLLTLRANEYYAEILGENHPDYQFYRNISKRILGTFRLLKIEEKGYILEHLTSKKQIFLSNDYTTFKKNQLVENETILSICLVKWEGDIWKMQGGCIIHPEFPKKSEFINEHIFDDEIKKKESLEVFEKAFLYSSGGKRIIYLRGEKEFIDFHLSVFRSHTQIVNPEISKSEMEVNKKNFMNNRDKMPFNEDEELCIFFNPNSGIEIYRSLVVACMTDKDNPYFKDQKLNVSFLLTEKYFSKEFLDYVIENKIFNFEIGEYVNPDMFRIVMDNFDFLLRFFRRSNYWVNSMITLV